MKLSVSEQIICELHTMGAINEQTGLNGKEVTELVNNAKAPSRLAELRKAGYVKSSDRSTGAMRFWLTPAGETYAIELKHYAEESKQDQSTDANLSTANNASENKDLTDATIINDATSQANSDDDCFKYPIYKISKATGIVVKFTDLTVGAVVRQGVDEGDIVGVMGKVYAYFPAHNDDTFWANWTPTKEELAVIPESENPLPQYNPDDVAFKKADITESWYMVDGIDAQFETSSDAIAAAHDYVATHTMSTTVHIVASRKFAIIKPVVTTELEYV